MSKGLSIIPDTTTAVPPANILALSRGRGALIRVIDRWVGIPMLYLLKLSRADRKPKVVKGMPRKVLLVKFWGIGNLLMTLPSICSMRREWPKVQVDFLTLEHNREALEATGVINGISVISLRGPRAFLATWWSAVRALRKERYDVIIDCEQFARFSALISGQINAPMTFGFETRGQSRHHLFTHAVPYNNEIHVTRSFYSLLQAAGALSPLSEMQLETLPALRVRGRLVLSRFNSVRGRATVLIHVGTSANFSERRWPLERYAELADLLIENCSASIIFTGLPDEKRLTEETMRLLRHPEHAVDIAGKCRFPDYLALISFVDLVISADTSAVHAASAVGTSVVGLYGPNTPLLYGPWNSNSIVFYKKLPCSPCITNFNEKMHVCRHPEGKGACMARISSREVFEAIAERYFPQKPSIRSEVTGGDRCIG